jgi:Vitamin B6 photo-protection and homoeostasis
MPEHNNNMLARRNLHRLRRLTTETSPAASTATNTRHPVRVVEVRVTTNQKTLYSYDGTSPHWQTSPVETETSSSITTTTTLQQALHNNITTHFLPAHYPHSVADGYAQFSLLAFAASVAGSAAMVLSTQTLLLAVGVVGSNSTSSGVMAGALNWVLKDGIGQLGGVLYASKMGQTKRFDADPKRGRMMAALSLDAASLLEILSPWVASSHVLPLACLANVGKNIGFLTASASRAALHQSLAQQGNLADVTAKAASQSMAAGLLGTAIGIGLSTFVLQQDATNFIVGFCGLSLVHQGCNYKSLQAVPLLHFNAHRLHLVLSYYLETNVVLLPTQVAQREQFFPLVVHPDDSHSWLSIGSPLQQFCPVEEFEQLHHLFQEEAYLINWVDNGKVQLIFLEQATGTDLIKGMHHAYVLYHQQSKIGDKKMATAAGSIELVAFSYQTAKVTFEEFLEKLIHSGWKAGTNVTNMESSTACRLSFLKQSLYK